MRAAENTANADVNDDRDAVMIAMSQSPSTSRPRTFGSLSTTAMRRCPPGLQATNRPVQLATNVAEEPGAFGLRFQPMDARSSGTDVRGAIWIDTATYQVRRISYEYFEPAPSGTEFRVGLGS
jgi:hypothetical protein